MVQIIVLEREVECLYKFCCNSGGKTIGEGKRLRHKPSEKFVCGDYCRNMACYFQSLSPEDFEEVELGYGK